MFTLINEVSFDIILYSDEDLVVGRRKIELILLLSFSCRYYPFLCNETGKKDVITLDMIFLAQESLLYFK